MCSLVDEVDDGDTSRGRAILPSSGLRGRRDGELLVPVGHGESSRE